MLRIPILVAYYLNVDFLGIICLQSGYFIYYCLCFICTMWLQSTGDLSTAPSLTNAFVRPSRAAPATREYQSDDSDLHVHYLLVLDVHYIVYFLIIVHYMVAFPEICYMLLQFLF